MCVRRTNLASNTLDGCANQSKHFVTLAQMKRPIQPWLLKTRPAQYRPALARHERNYGGGAARRAIDASFHRPTHICAFCLALLAVLALVLELFLAKENLLAG